MKKLIAGNWKMNGALAANEALVEAVLAGMPASPCAVAVCVPAPYLAQVGGLLAGKTIALGAQDVSAHESGAFTGEVSAAMLRDLAVRYAIVGHSERRQYHGETDAVVADKARQALSLGITPIVCVGETLAQRESGAHRRSGQAPTGCGDPCERTLHQRNRAWPTSRCGRSAPARPPVREQAQQVHAVLRAQLKAATAQAGRIRILYGGSMNAGQCRAVAGAAGYRWWLDRRGFAQAS